MKHKLNVNKLRHYNDVTLSTHGKVRTS